MKACLAEITALAGDERINIYDVEIAHSAEGPRGVLILMVDSSGRHGACVTPLSGTAIASRSRICRECGACHRGADLAHGRGRRPLNGIVRTPGEKSISHRALLLSALADGTSTISGLSDGDDVARTRAAIGP